MFIQVVRQYSSSVTPRGLASVDATEKVKKTWVISYQDFDKKYSIAYHFMIISIFILDGHKIGQVIFLPDTAYSEYGEEIDLYTSMWSDLK